jgi:hypothetical protein
MKTFEFYRDEKIKERKEKAYNVQKERKQNVERKARY